MTVITFSRKIRITNYQIFMGASIITSLAMGLFGPFFFVFIQGFGKSMQSLGYAVGLMIFAQSVTFYFTGILSDRFGRKIFLVGAGIGNGLVIIAYTFITSLTHLYILQVLYGIVWAMKSNATSTFMADITEEKTRGRSYGKLNAVLGVAGAGAIASAGMLADRFGSETIFYLVGGFSLISALILLFIKEEKSA